FDLASNETEKRERYGRTANSQRTTASGHVGVTVPKRHPQDQGASTAGCPDDRDYQEGKTSVRARGSDLAQRKDRQEIEPAKPGRGRQINEGLSTELRL